MNEDERIHTARGDHQSPVDSLAEPCRRGKHTGLVRDQGIGGGACSRVNSPRNAASTGLPGPLSSYGTRPNKWVLRGLKAVQPMGCAMIGRACKNGSGASTE